MKSTRTAGWTLLELMITLTLLALLSAKVVTVMKMANDAAGDQSMAIHVENQANEILDRIGLAIMGSDRGTLVPSVEGLNYSGLRYKLSLGTENGVTVWDDTEEIRLAGVGTRIEWRENPDEAEERRLVWTKLASQLLEGEVLNGVDDNGNGLVDEQGLTFVIDRNMVTIRMTLRATSGVGREVIRTVERVVVCRN